MIDYRSWKETTINVTSLLLDPQNPRIPESSDSVTQRALLADLLENDKVYDLAKNIMHNGYYPVEALIYVEEGSKKYVLEGNRRLAALKLLISPEVAPDKDWERKFRSLGNRIDLFLDTIRKVKTLRAPSREAAAPIIMSKHTRGQVENWSPLMQAKFYRNLVDRGLTVDEIADQYKFPVSEITDALQRYTMYSIACSLNLPADVAKKVHNPREFPVTNLERLYKNQKVVSFLGISFDEKRQLVGAIAIDEFRKGYSKIITDIAAGEVHSRNVNTTAEMEKYLSSFGTQTPDQTRKGTFTTENLLEGAPKRTRPSSPPPRRRPAPKPIQRGIIPPDCSCDLNNQRINDVFNELAKLPVGRYPNAVALMFRSLLEMSLGYHLDRTGHLSVLVDKERERREKKGGVLPRTWHPTLTQMLQYLVADDDGIISNPNLTRALQKLISDKDSLLSIDTLNLFVHNQHFYPNEDGLRAFWPQLQGLFEIILVEPEIELETD